jgi:excisionase family DNA binding protein
MTFPEKSIHNLTITEMDEQVLTEIRELKKLIFEQNMLQKEVLNFNEATVYLEVSHSHLYKLTSTGTIPAYKPNGKKLYFNREELNRWLLSNRQASVSDIEEEVSRFKLKSGRAK